MGATLRFTSPAMRKSFAQKETQLNTVGAYTPFVSADGVLFMEIIILKANEGATISFDMPYEKKKLVHHLDTRFKFSVEMKNHFARRITSSQNRDIQIQPSSVKL